MRSWSESKAGWLLDRLNWDYAAKRTRREYWNVRGLWIDYRFGGSTFVNQQSRYRNLGVTIVQSLDYESLAAVMRQIVVSEDDVLVDVGCATGRVINWWLALGLSNRIVGVELDAEIAAQTKKRLARYSNVEIRAGDAVELTPADATLCYLYNPFDDRVLQRWLSRLLERRTSQRLRVVYVNPVYRDAFGTCGNWSVTTTSVPTHEVAIFDLIELPCAA